MLIGYAFSVKEHQISRAPDWGATEYFDIDAIATPSTTTDQSRLMLRTLLEERFALRARIETRQAPVHVLRLLRSDGRLGPDLTPAGEACSQTSTPVVGTALPPASSTGLPPLSACGGMRMTRAPGGGNLVLFRGVEMERLISVISSSVGAPVIDETGLTGLFDVRLEYTPDRSPAPAAADLSKSDAPPPPLAGAVQQQLGLRLEETVGPLPVLIVESAARPTPN
jgi:uncharacterized protein (TIGR03435 family)